MSNIKEINKLFKNGIIPNEFFYNTEIRKNIDFYKLYYNDYYKSPDYIASKLPIGWESIPGFDQVIEEMANMTFLPMQEIELKKNNAEYYNNNFIENNKKSNDI
jgi:hypothetical protein